MAPPRFVSGSYPPYLVHVNRFRPANRSSMFSTPITRRTSRGSTFHVSETSRSFMYPASSTHASRAPLNTQLSDAPFTRHQFSPIGTALPFPVAGSTPGPTTGPGYQFDVPQLFSLPVHVSTPACVTHVARLSVSLCVP